MTLSETVSETQVASGANQTATPTPVTVSISLTQLCADQCVAEITSSKTVVQAPLTVSLPEVV